MKEIYRFQFHWAQMDLGEVTDLVNAELYGFQITSSHWLWKICNQVLKQTI